MKNNFFIQNFRCFKFSGHFKLGPSYGLTCSFGECGMTHRVISHDDQQKLEFSVTVSHGDDGKINLGDNTIKTSSADIAVEFTCMYGMDVTVSSAKYTINAVAASGVTSSTGSLSDGFQFTVTSADDFSLGSVINVAATWEVSLPRLSYYFEQCEVQQDTESVVLIKNGCISGALSVGELNMSGATLSFNYKQSCKIAYPR